MKNLSITAGSKMSRLGKSHPKNGFSETQHLVLKANTIFGVCNKLLRNTEIKKQQPLDLMAKPISGLCKGTQIVSTLCTPQFIDLKAKRNFELCNKLLRNVELCAATIKAVPKMGDPLAMLTSEQRGAL